MVGQLNWSKVEGWRAFDISPWSLLSKEDEQDLCERGSSSISEEEREWWEGMGRGLRGQFETG